MNANHGHRSVKSTLSRYRTVVTLGILLVLLTGFGTADVFGQTLGWPGGGFKYFVCNPEYLSSSEISGTIEIGILGIQVEETSSAGSVAPM